ncbi:MAG: transposase, partial [Pseudomonadota bacterium]
MRQSKFTESQILAALKQAESGLPVNDVCRQIGVSPATFYKWRAKYGGLDASDLSRMR